MQLLPFPHEGDLVSTHWLAFSLENSISCITLSKNSESNFLYVQQKRLGDANCLYGNESFGSSSDFLYTYAYKITNSVLF